VGTGGRTKAPGCVARLISEILGDQDYWSKRFKETIGRNWNRKACDLTRVSVVRVHSTPLCNAFVLEGIANTR
jgi:hypothetical protein